MLALKIQKDVILSHFTLFLKAIFPIPRKYYIAQYIPHDNFLI